MDVTGAVWADEGQMAIRATIDGAEVFVPDDMANRERRAIAEWEAEGNTIGEYAAPPAPARTIAGAYFRAALTDLDHMSSVRAALTDPIDLELFNTATEFNEDAPDVNAVATALSIDLSSVFDRAEVIRAARQS